MSPTSDAEYPGPDTPALRFGGLYRLQAWLSPSYPVGGFSYSHGLEWAVESAAVHDRATLVDFVEAVLRRGGGWTDQVFLAQAWMAAQPHPEGDEELLDEIVDRAVAWRGSMETALESSAQGSAFAAITMAAWPGTALDGLVRRRKGKPLSYAVAVGAAAARLAPLEAALTCYGLAVAGGLVSAGLRLIPLGQTEGQRALATLEPIVARTAALALVANLDELGTAAPMLDLCSMRHETQYSRLFRS